MFAQLFALIASYFAHHFPFAVTTHCTWQPLYGFMGHIGRLDCLVSKLS